MNSMFTIELSHTDELCYQYDTLNVLVIKYRFQATGPDFPLAEAAALTSAHSS